MCSVHNLSNPHQDQIEAIMSGSRSVQELIVTRSDPAQFIGQDLNRLTMLTDHSMYSPSTYSIESFADENRQVDRIRPKVHHPRRSLTISTSGSSTETATNRGRMANNLHDVDTPVGDDNSGEKSGLSSHDRASVSRICSIKMKSSHSASAGHNPARPAPKRADSSRPHRPELSILTVPPPEGVSQGSSPAGMTPESPFQIEPRIIHHSMPPWSKGGLGEARAEGTDSDCRTVKSIHRINPNLIGQSPLAKPYRHAPTLSQPKTGLKKLVRSVKVSLWSAQSPGAHDQFNESPVDSLAPPRPPSTSQSTSSIRPVDVHPRTVPVHRHPKPMNMTANYDQNELNGHIPRSFSACSYTTNSTATTSTSQSSSITPSSSCSSLPTAEPDCGAVHLPGTDDRNGYEKLAPKDYPPDLIISLGPSDPQRHSNMSTQTALPVLDPPARSLGCSFNNNHIHHIPSKQEQVKPSSNLRTKASFGFLHTLKRAVTGNDPSLAFSFNNNMSPSLTTSAVSLPIGTVLRNNGLDPLPACHPLPITTSQSSPSRLDCPSTLSTSRAPLGLSHARSVSVFSPDLSNHHQNPNPASFPGIKPNPLLHPLGSPNRLGCTTNVTQEAPTLNLRPVSMSFAAGFSDQLLLSDTQPLALEEDHLQEEPPKPNSLQTDLKSCSSQTHCSCCITLADENARLKNRIKELELRISGNDYLRLG